MENIKNRTEELVSLREKGVDLNMYHGLDMMIAEGLPS